MKRSKDLVEAVVKVASCTNYDVIKMTDPKKHTVDTICDWAYAVMGRVGREDVPREIAETACGVVEAYAWALGVLARLGGSRIKSAHDLAAERYFSDIASPELCGKRG